MEEEMLQYWEYNQAMNTIFANQMGSTIRILRKSISNREQTTDPFIKKMYGDPKEVQKIIEEFEGNYQTYLSNIEEAKKQVEHYKKLTYSKIHDIDRFQNN